jgi:hypothetical protein
MRDAKKDDDWDWLGVYLFRDDGTYGSATWIKGPDELKKMLPSIQGHVRNKLEVRITNSGDELLFHSMEGGVEWDGIGLTQLMPA